MEVNWWYVGAVSVSTWLLYEFNGIIQLELSKVPAFFQTKVGVLCLFLGGLILWLLWISHYSFKYILPYFLLASCLSLFYFRPIYKGFSFRSSTYLKFFVIGLVFGIMTGLIPYSGYDLSVHIILLLLISRLLFVASLAIAFDVGDMLDDKQEKTPTIVTKWGKKMSKTLAFLFILTSLMIDSWCYDRGILQANPHWAMNISYLISMVLIYISNEQRSKNYFLFAVDGVMGLPYLLSLFI